MQSPAWSRDLRVTADGTGVVSHVDTALLRLLADRAGLTAALSAGLARRGWRPVHDRGRVLVGLAVMIADGGEAIVDIDVLRHQREVFEPVASDTTVWRALDEIDQVRLGRIAAARAKVRARMWRLFGGPPPARAAGREFGAGVVVLDVDSTIVIAHSDKEAAPTYKRTAGFHPILVTCDTSESSRSSCGRPVSGDQLAVPAQQGGWGDEERRPAGPGQQPGQGGEHNVVVRAQLGSVHLPPQDRDMVAQDQEFDVLGAVVTGELGRRLQDLPE